MSGATDQIMGAQRRRGKGKEENSDQATRKNSSKNPSESSSPLPGSPKDKGDLVSAASPSKISQSQEQEEQEEKRENPGSELPQDEAENVGDPLVPQPFKLEQNASSSQSTQQFVRGKKDPENPPSNISNKISLKSSQSSEEESKTLEKLDKAPIHTSPSKSGSKFPVQKQIAFHPSGGKSTLVYPPSQNHSSKGKPNPLNIISRKTIPSIKEQSATPIEERESLSSPKTAESEDASLLAPQKSPSASISALGKTIAPLEKMASSGEVVEIEDMRDPATMTFTEIVRSDNEPVPKTPPAEEEPGTEEPKDKIEADTSEFLGQEPKARREEGTEFGVKEEVDRLTQKPLPGETPYSDSDDDEQNRKSSGKTSELRSNATQTLNLAEELGISVSENGNERRGMEDVELCSNPTNSPEPGPQHRFTDSYDIYRADPTPPRSPTLSFDRGSPQSFADVTHPPERGTDSDNIGPLPDFSNIPGGLSSLSPTFAPPALTGGPSAHRPVDPTNVGGILEVDNLNLNAPFINSEDHYIREREDIMTQRATALGNPDSEQRFKDSEDLIERLEREMYPERFRREHDGTEESEENNLPMSLGQQWEDFKNDPKNKASACVEMASAYIASLHHDAMQVTTQNFKIQHEVTKLKNKVEQLENGLNGPTAEEFESKFQVIHELEQDNERLQARAYQLKHSSDWYERKYNEQRDQHKADFADLEKEYMNKTQELQKRSDNLTMMFMDERKKAQRLADVEKNLEKNETDLANVLIALKEKERQLISLQLARETKLSEEDARLQLADQEQTVADPEKENRDIKRENSMLTQDLKKMIDKYLAESPQLINILMIDDSHDPHSKEGDSSKPPCPNKTDFESERKKSMVQVLNEQLEVQLRDVQNRLRISLEANSKLTADNNSLRNQTHWARKSFEKEIRQSADSSNALYENIKELQRELEDANKKLRESNNEVLRVKPYVEQVKTLKKIVKNLTKGGKAGHDAAAQETIANLETHIAWVEGEVVKANEERDRTLDKCTLGEKEIKDLKLQITEFGARLNNLARLGGVVSSSTSGGSIDPNPNQCAAERRKVKEQEEQIDILARDNHNLQKKLDAAGRGEVLPEELQREVNAANPEGKPIAQLFIEKTRQYEQLEDFLKERGRLPQESTQTILQYPKTQPSAATGTSTGTALRPLNQRIIKLQSISGQSGRDSGFVSAKPPLRWRDRSERDEGQESEKGNSASIANVVKRRDVCGSQDSKNISSQVVDLRIYRIQVALRHMISERAIHGVRPADCEDIHDMVHEGVAMAKTLLYAEGYAWMQFLYGMTLWYMGSAADALKHFLAIDVKAWPEEERIVRGWIEKAKKQPLGKRQANYGWTNPFDKVAERGKPERRGRLRKPNDGKKVEEPRHSFNKIRHEKKDDDSEDENDPRSESRIGRKRQPKDSCQHNKPSGLVSGSQTDNQGSRFTGAQQVFRISHWDPTSLHHQVQELFRRWKPYKKEIAVKNDEIDAEAMQSILDRASAAITGELAFEVNLMKKIESILHNMAVNPSKNGPASEWSRSKKEAGENSEGDVDEVFYEDILGQNILDKHSRRVMRRVNAILAGEAPGEEAVMKMVAKLLKRNTTEGAPLLEREPTEKEVARAKSMAKALAQGPSDATPEGLLKWHDKCIGRTRVPPLKSRDLRHFYREWCNKYGKQSQISEEEDRQESSDDGRSGLPPDVEIMQCVPPESRTPNISESEPEDDAIQETTNLAPR